MSGMQLVILFFPWNIILHSIFPKSSSIVAAADGCRNLNSKKLITSIKKIPSCEYISPKQLF